MTQDPLGLAGGVNLYAYAGNNPVSFRDPYGLCASGDPPDEIAVLVCVRRGTTVTEEEITAKRVTDEALLREIAEGAARLKGGSPTFTPAGVQEELASTVTSGAVYVFERRAPDGGEVTTLAATIGQSLAMRLDVAAQLRSGPSFLHRRIDGKYDTACQVLGHEGVHLVQHRRGSNDSELNEREALAITWRCR